MTFVLFPSQLFTLKPGSRFPDTVAVTYDPANGWLSCIYSDHSVYVWDVGQLCDLRRVGKLFSALYHSSCVWSAEVSLAAASGSSSPFPPGTLGLIRVTVTT